MNFPFKNWRAPARRAYHPHPPSPPQNPKVVPYPVHIVGSDDTNNKKQPAAQPMEADKSAAAVRIQKVVRGFLVRKMVRTVRKVAAEAEEIAKWIPAAAEAIHRDARERLRLGEILMALLLRLDTVRGVREYRKKVIRRLIQLQEAVDSIAAAAAIPPDRVLEAPESLEMTQDTAETSETKAPESSIKVVKDGEAPGTPVLSPFASREVEESMIGDGTKGEEGDEMQGVVSPGEAAAAENWGMKEVMEKWAAESEQLRGQVAELCERSAKQCRVMDRLRQRVDQLEGTVQRMKPKKKKMQAHTLSSSHH